MSGTSAGAEKTAARRCGVSIDAYRAQIRAGLKWCFRCRQWHPLDRFGVDRGRTDGLAASCRESKNRNGRSRYVSRATGRNGGPPPAPPRDRDVRQARHSVNLLVRSGRLPRPNDLPCADCGHVWEEGERRHEYDHYLGYAAEHHLDVEAVCTTCHVRRDRQKEVVRTHG